MRTKSPSLAIVFFVLALQFWCHPAIASERPLLGITMTSLDSNLCAEWIAGDLSQIEHGVVIWV